MKFFIIKPTRRTIFPNLCFVKKLNMFGQFLCPPSGVFHCTFSTGICHQTCPKPVEFLDKKYIWEISASVWFYYKGIRYDARSHEREILHEVILSLFVTQSNENVSNGSYTSSTIFVLLWHVSQTFGVLFVSINFAMADCHSVTTRE